MVGASNHGPILRFSPSALNVGWPSKARRIALPNRFHGTHDLDLPCIRFETDDYFCHCYNSVLNCYVY